VAVQFSPVIAVPAQGDGYPFISHSVDVRELGRFASPILMCDEGHVAAGRSARIRTPASRRCRTCSRTRATSCARAIRSGNDVVTGPGGMVWTQAGSGLVHEEMAAKPDGGEVGDRVRVLVGSFGGISFGVQDGHNAVVYVMSGAIAVRANGGEQRTAAGHAVALGGVRAASRWPRLRPRLRWCCPAPRSASRSSPLGRSS
jgi:hypothetical protein